ncbi:MAG: MFS transporter [Actinomycetota bacterium]|nr:MFS transporter [Actinomycetota bacterium]
MDAACAALLLGAVSAGRLSGGSALGVFLIYNVVAFALQPLAGLLVDRGWSARSAAVAGACATAVAVALSLAPGTLMTAVLLAGLGNAAFHAGGGVASLRMTPGRAFAPGIFVAPGAAGLAAGGLLGKLGGSVWVAAAVLGVLAVALALLPDVEAAGGGLAAESPRTATESPHAHAENPALIGVGCWAVEGAVLLVLAVVALRSYTGLAISLPWKSSLGLLAALTVAVVLGKALGGVLADRYGFARVGVGALVASAPLLMMAPSAPAAGIAGMLLFNMTMPVTLVAVARTLPENQGFAFGLASLALAVGAFPVLAGMTGKLSAALPIAVAVGVSAAVLAAALWWLGRGGSVGAQRAATIAEVTE